MGEDAGTAGAFGVRGGGSGLGRVHDLPDRLTANAEQFGNVNDLPLAREDGPAYLCVKPLARPVGALLVTPVGACECNQVTLSHAPIFAYPLCAMHVGVRKRQVSWRKIRASRLVSDRQEGDAT